MNTFYKIISYIFSPFLLCTFAIVWLMTTPLFANYFQMEYKVVAVIGTFVFTALLPFLPILVMMMRGEITDIFISMREQRTVPYLFSFLAYCFWWFFLWRTLELPLFISSVGLSSAIAVIIIMFVNFRWKISAHLCSMGGIFAFVVGVSWHYSANPLYFIIILLIITLLLAVSRIELKAHTPTQTIAGFAVGFTCTILPILFL